MKRAFAPAARAAMIGAALLLPFCGSARADGGFRRDLLDQAERLSKEGRNEEAAKAAQGALADAEKSLGPENLEIGHILARLSWFYQGVGDASQLAEIGNRLSAINPKNFEVWLALGRLLRFQEKSLEAEDALRKALAFKPDDFDAEHELAMVDQDMGRDEDAVKLFERVIKKNPQDYDLYIHLARSDMRLGRSAEAKEAFAQARKLEGRSVDAYIDEAYFHLDVGEPAQAKEAFERAIAVDTASPFGYHHMGAYLEHSQQYSEAEKYYWRALERLAANPNMKTDDFLHTVNGLGDVIRLQGRYAEAEAVYRKCLEKAVPSGLYVNCLRSLGNIYASQDKNAQAEDIFKRETAACEKGPACSCRGRSLIDLGDFYLKQGRISEAAAMADQAGELCGGYQTSNFSLLIDLAELYMGLGDVSKGEELYGRILAAGRSRPFNLAFAWALGRMADSDMTQGRFHEAEDIYRQAAAIWENHHDGPQEVAALDGLAAACEKEGKTQEAAEAEKKAQALRDGSSTAAGTSWQELLNQAERLSEEGKNEESVRAAQGALADAGKSPGPEAADFDQILSRLRHIYAQVGDGAQFPEIEKRLAALKSRNFNAWMALGTLLHSQEKLLEAEDALKKALAFKPDDLDAAVELAMVDQDLGRDEDAVKLFEKAIDKKPPDHDAVKISKKGIDKKPRDYDLYIHLARSDMRLGRYAQAKEAFAQAEKRGGKSNDAYIQEGYFHRDLGESAQAKEAFEKAIAVDTASPFGYHHLAAYLSDHHQYPEAEKYFRQALVRLEANPNTLTSDLLHTLSMLGNVLLEQGRSAEAETIFRKCVDKAALQATYIKCFMSLGIIYADQDKNAEAEDVLKRAAAVCEGGPACTCRGMALIGLGDFYRKRGRKGEASAMAGQAEKLCTADHPSDLFMLLDLAELYVSLGDVSKGESLYGQVLTAERSMPFNGVLPRAQGRMADLDMTQGRFHEAEALYRQAASIWENRRDWKQEAVMLDGVAAACEKQGRPREAAEARETTKALGARP